jgi:hypothetical protein
MLPVMRECSVCLADVPKDLATDFFACKCSSTVCKDCLEGIKKMFWRKWKCPTCRKDSPMKTVLLKLEEFSTLAVSPDDTINLEGLRKWLEYSKTQAVEEAVSHFGSEKRDEFLKQVAEIEDYFTQDHEDEGDGADDGSDQGDGADDGSDQGDGADDGPEGADYSTQLRRSARLSARLHRSFHPYGRTN